MTGATRRGVSRSLKAPRYDLVIPVRAVDTITASFIIVLLLPKPYAGAYGRALATYACRCHPQPERGEGDISVGSSGGHDRARELPPALASFEPFLGETRGQGAGGVSV